MSSSEPVATAEPASVQGSSLTARLGSYPVVGAALTRAVTSLSCAYDSYGKHSSSPLVRRCVGAVESKLQPHLSRVEPVVHAGLDRLEGSVSTIRHTADTAVHAGMGRIETTVTSIRGTADTAVNASLGRLESTVTTLRTTADTAVSAGLGRIESTVTSIRSTADLAVRQWRHLPATINHVVATTAVKVEGKVTAIASVGLTKADAVVGWALAHVAEAEDGAKVPAVVVVDDADSTAIATGPATAAAPVLDASEWPTPEETREHDAEEYAHRHHIPPAFGAETKRVLTHLRALTTKIATELLPATLFQLRQLPSRGCQAVRSRVGASTTAACGSVRGGVRQHKDRASARVRQMRRAVQAKFTDVHLDNLIQQLFVFGLEGSARSLELLLRFTPDRVVALIRRKLGVDLRQVRRRLRILVNRAKAGQPIRPPTPTTPAPTATTSASTTDVSTAPTVSYSEALKHPASAPTPPTSTSHAYVAGAAVGLHRHLRARPVDADADVDEDDGNDPEENYSSDEVDDNETTGDDDDDDDDNDNADNATHED